MNLWYTEQEADRIRTGFATTQVLFSERSEFQQVDVIETKAYGRMLLLDGMVMVTDIDEFVYHEMISHIPVCLHPNPKKVVVIGGGDGGTVRELLKHPEIEEIVLCEIDGLVIEASKKFFPKLADQLGNPRVKVKVGDGIDYVKHLNSEVDIMLIDSTDPIGPGEGLFSREFYTNVAKALRPGGLMAAQAESPWLDKAIHHRISNNIRAGFKNILPYVGSIPTYPRGMWSWKVAAQHSINPASFDRARFAKIAQSLDYLTEDLMTAAFAIPKFFQKLHEN